VAVPADVRAFVDDHGLTTRSSLRAGGHTAAVAVLYAAITAVGFLLDSGLVWAFVVVAQGYVLLGSYSAMHEAAHGNLFRTRRANRIACWFWSSSLLTNGSVWRSFHLEHHARTAGPDDPENRYKVDVTSPWQYLLMPLGGLQFFLVQLWESLGTLVGRFPIYVRQGANRRAMRLDALLHVALLVGIVVAAVIQPSLLLRLWGGAFLLVTCVLLPGTAINEHYRCAPSGDAFATTRTIVSNRLVRFLVWNSNYHVEHHLVANVPYHHAPELHAYLEPRLQHLAPSYTAFHLDVLRSCRPASVVAAP
jgi:fatty acid desaturase